MSVEPVDHLITVKAVASLLSMGVSTVWLKTKQGKFPEPIKISPQVTRWRLSDVNAWLENPTGWAASKESKQ